MMDITSIFSICVPKAKGMDACVACVSASRLSGHMPLSSFGGAPSAKVLLPPPLLTLNMRDTEEHESGVKVNICQCSTILIDVDPGGWIHIICDACGIDFSQQPEVIN